MNICRHIREKHIERNCIEAGDSEGDECLTQVVVQQQAQRLGPAGGLLLLRHLCPHLLICGGVLQMHPDVAADESQWPCQEEGDSPPPGIHDVIAENREHPCDHERAGK